MLEEIAKASRHSAIETENKLFIGHIKKMEQSPIETCYWFSCPVELSERVLIEIRELVSKHINETDNNF